MQPDFNILSTTQDHLRMKLKKEEKTHDGDGDDDNNVQLISILAIDSSVTRLQLLESTDFVL